MALVVLSDGRKLELPAQQAVNIWLVLSGELEPDEEQATFCAKVKRVYLNWRTAPDSYIQKYFDVVKGKAKEDWRVDRHGKPTKPQYDADWAFANRWDFAPVRGV